MKRHAIATTALAALLSFTLVGCGAAGSTAAETEASASAAVTLVEAASAEASQVAASADASTEDSLWTAPCAGYLDTADMFTDRDLTQEADLSAATYLTLADGQNITITEAGVYVISGAATGATIYVEAAEDAKIQIVLDGVTIENETAPAIYVKTAKKVWVTTANGSQNSLSVTGSFAADGTDTPDAVVYSCEDLVLNGAGTLTISSSDKGISSKDDLKVTGGTYSISSTGHALDANDSIAVYDGSFTISTSADGLHASNSDDATKGYVYIAGGTFGITAGSDGIHASYAVQIDGGTVNVTAPEGIEGAYIQINAGAVSVSATDDGINATCDTGSVTPAIEINGGEVNVTIGQGDTDALDSNGSIYINGGTVNISAQSPFDYDYEGQLNGGTVYVNGEQVTQLTTQMMGGGAMGGRIG